MNRIAPIALALVVAGLAWSAVRSTAQSPGGPALPGARPTVEAIDYPSLQAAIDALPPEGGLVRLPAGRFEIDEALRIGGEDVAIEGAGTATHIVNADAEGEPAIVIESPEYAEDAGARIWRVRVADLRLTGNEGSGHGILARGVNEIFLDGVTVSEHGGDGIRLDSCYEDPRICDALITYNAGAGLHLIGCHDIVVAGNQFEENQDAVRCVDGFNLCMTGNCVDDHLRHGVVIENTYGSVVSGNMIEECRGTGIVLDRDCYGITLASNVIAHEMTDGIDLRDAHGCAVSANTFTIVRRHALVIGPDSGRITVTGNNFGDSTIGPDAEKRAEGDRDAGGLFLDGAGQVVVSGNVFAGLDPSGVSIDGDPSPAIFGHNLQVDPEGMVPGRPGVVVQGNIGL